MNRREFLVGAGGVLTSGLTSVGQLGDDGGVSGQVDGAMEGSRNGGTDWKGASQYLLWTGPDGEASEAALVSRFKEWKSKGLTGVFLGGYDAKNVAALREAGLDVHIWMWTTNRRDEWVRENHPDWFMVSRTGKSCYDAPPYVDYYRWVSPVIPGVQSYLRDRVAEIVEKDGVDGVHLDYVRYPDVILPTALWDTYRVDQTEEMPEFDFCYSEHTRKAFREVSGRDPMEIENPANDAEWLKFRYDSVTVLVNQLVGVAREHGKQITAAVFPTPSLARKICRQDWDKWPLDAFTPMVYHSFYNEDVAWIGDCLRENVQATTVPIVAGLYLPAFESADEFSAGLETVKRRGGKGVSLFGDIGEEYWAAFEKARW